MAMLVIRDVFVRTWDGEFDPPDAPALAGASWKLLDLLSEAEYDRGGDELLNPGLFLDMPPYAYPILDLQPS